jgi:hypothetical protein
MANVFEDLSASIVDLMIANVLLFSVNSWLKTDGGGQRNPQTCQKVTDKLKLLYHIMFYQVHLAMSGIQTHNFKHWLHKWMQI